VKVQNDGKTYTFDPDEVRKGFPIWASLHLPMPIKLREKLYRQAIEKKVIVEENVKTVEDKTL